jgi:hypothetical protein
MTYLQFVISVVVFVKRDLVKDQVSFRCYAGDDSRIRRAANKFVTLQSIVSVTKSIHTEITTRRN